MPQALNTLLKPITNVLRCIRNQLKAKARTMAVDIFSTFFFDSFNTWRFAKLLCPGVRLRQTLTAIAKWNIAMTTRGKAYIRTKVKTA